MITLVERCWRKRGRLMRRFLDVAKVDMRLAGVTEDDAGDRVRWRQVGEP